MRVGFLLVAILVGLWLGTASAATIEEARHRVKNDLILGVKAGTTHEAMKVLR
jgi:hypothetical protein